MGIDAEMFFKTRQAMDAPQVRALSVDLCEAFGPGRFWLFEESNRHALEPVEVYEQDGPDIEPADGEQFIRVRLATRYYGPDYERGDLPFIIEVAKWIEARIPDAVVYYGGDSSGVCAEPFDTQAREELFTHFAKVGHRPYGGYFDHTTNRPTCDFCATEMLCTGGGGDREFYFCQGCGKKVIRVGRDRIVLVPKSKDFFDVSHEIQQGVL